MAHFETTLGNLKEIASHVKNLKLPSQSQATTAQPGALSPAAVAAALAESLKSDNSTTQAIAVRIANLAAKYPNKAY